VEFMWIEENPTELEKLSFYKKKETTNIFWPLKFSQCGWLFILMIGIDDFETNF
jgi:hypothetical protein